MASDYSKKGYGLFMYFTIILNRKVAMHQQFLLIRGRSVAEARRESAESKLKVTVEWQLTESMFRYESSHSKML